MTDPLPHEWLLDRLDRLESRLLEHSRTVRAELLAAIAATDLKLTAVQTESGNARERLTIIETERREEQKQSIRIGAITGLLAATGLTALWEILKHKLGWK